MDIAIFEVGLGGRLDATNVVDPLVSVITAISFDHTAVLGNTLAEIAAQKAGIIKPGRPVVSSAQTGEALRVIEQTAHENGSRLILVGRDIHYQSIQHSLDGQECWVWNESDQPHMDAFLADESAARWKPERYFLPLLGAHQLENVTTAVAAVHMVQSSGFAVSESAIVDGIRQVFWPCRFEIISRQPMIILDSAHNRDSAQKLRQTLDDYLPGREVVMLFGASEDKDVQGILTDLIPRVTRVIATQSPHPRAAKANEIVAMVQALGRPARAVIPVDAALTDAVQTLQPDQVLLVTGSIFLAAIIREIWMQQQNNSSTPW